VRFVSTSNVAHPKDALDWEYLSGNYDRPAYSLAISEGKNYNY